MNVKEVSNLFTSKSDGNEIQDAILYLNQQGLFLDKTIFDENNKSIQPNFTDLARLHKTIVNRKVFTVLEFGVGWSTLVMADALFKNKRNWELYNDNDKNTILKDNMFKLYSVDTSEYWVEQTKNRISNDLLGFVSFEVSSVKIGDWQGRICHYYERLPDILPDFIYLDGPDPKDVKGEINGLTFNNKDRHVVSADILMLESLLLPRTMLLVDGRVSNSRFLEKNFFRSWDVAYNQNSDITVFELNEGAIGKKNKLKIKYQLGE